ncbi:MAG: hypothetical protein ABIG68_09230, partial [Acidobacteriota bacterium]
LVDRAGSRVMIEEAARDVKVKELCEKLRQKAMVYLDRPDPTRHVAADAFATRCREDVAEVTEFIVRRDNRILQAASGAIWRGPVFRADFTGIQGAGNDERDSPTGGRPRRIFQFIDLWTDCNGQG